jgi:TolB-like protein/Flp pilus assembly protein TadD
MTGKTSFGPFVLDRERRQLMRGGQAVPVGHRGYTLLETLLDAGGETVSRDALMERVWPGTIIEEGSLTVQVSALRRQLGEGADAMIVTVPRIGYRFVAPAEQPTGAERSGPPLIAVLPFASHGSAADDGYFADGVVDDIITALSRFKTFAVLSRGSTLALRDKGALDVARELGVRYALEGSIRRAGDRLRVTAQLSDARTGAQLWAEKYDGAVADIFAFQDRITEAVVGQIEPTVRLAEIERVRRKPAQSLDAYDHFLRALPIAYEPGIERHAEGIALLKQAMRLDKNFALAPAYVALIYVNRISLQAPPLSEDDGAEAVAHARLALALDSEDAVVKALCAWALFRVEDDVHALDAVRVAVASNPNNAVVLRYAAAVVGMAGAAQEAFDYNRRAYDLSPGGPEAYDALYGMASSQLVMGNDEAAIHWALKSLATYKDLLLTYVTLTAAYANLERMDEARAMLGKVRELSPHLTIEVIERGRAVRDSFADVVLPALKKAGLLQK